jgi:tetratricopeptide (TPR) repeat protein
VESVAWISERKDLLSTFFLMFTLWAYANYVRSRQQNASPLRNQSWRWYALALICFALGLMSKPMLVTLPCVLLLLDYWPFERLGPSTLTDSDRLRKLAPLVREKLPFFLLSLGSSIVTFVVQRSAGAVSALEALPISARIGNAIVSYWSYVLKTLWPVDLSIYYPHPGAWPVGRVVGALVGLLGITAVIAFYSRNRTRRYLWVGWLWFLGTLVPVIGLVQVGSQSMADRYTYIPSIGLFVALAWGAGGWLSAHRRAIPLGVALALGILAGAGVLTRIQAGYWQSSETLFSQALRVEEKNFLAHFSLGNALIDQGQIEPGRRHLERAAELNPRAPTVQGALACLAVKERAFQAAVSRYGEVIRLQPDCAEALNNLAWLLATCPEPTVRNGARAVSLAERACEITRFQNTLFIGTLAAAYAEAGRFSEAVAMAQKASQVGAIWNENALIKKNQELAELYRAGTPYHEAQ